MAMLYRFGDFELDTAKVELRQCGAVVPMERQVFALLVLLVENRERLLSRDEILEKVWDGRIVSDAAIASRIKSVRKALGDDGKSQRCIRTVHRQGFRFVADVRAAASTSSGERAEHPAKAADSAAILTPAIPAADPHVEPATLAGFAAGVDESGPAARPARPSIAVLPFHFAGDAGRYAALADALPHELIADLSRLRWLFVTARGSSFRLRASDMEVGEIGRLLDVRYCLTGTVEISGSGLHVTVELVDTASGGIVWADRYSGAIDRVHEVRAEIRARILAALEIRIPLHEAELAGRKVTGNLDAWSSYHLGLQHIYRFNRRDNAAARTLFEQAISRDPGFARAHAGLSFVHFQTAFLGHAVDLDTEIALARRFAERGVELDALDPFVNFTMGRTYWLAGDLDSSLTWLERATSISPNYAQGIYACAWAETLSGRGTMGRDHVDLAMRLSPLDPLYYAMLGTRAFSHMAEGEDAEAALWAERAARSPGAHVLIALIACVANALAGDATRAEFWAGNVRERNPALGQAGFFRSFPMQSENMATRVAAALGRHGF